MDPLISELLKQAAVENAPMVDPVDDKRPTSTKPGMATFLAGLGADAATTTYGSMSGKTTEANPLMKWAGKGAGPAVGGIGIISALLAKKALGKNHPKALNALLMAMGGLHGGAALSNMRQIGRSNSAQPASNTPDAHSGDYINPDYFPTLGK